MKKVKAALISAFAAFLIIAALLTVVKIPLMNHTPYDSYTLQALAWHKGQMFLDVPPQSVAYLELAEYQGKLFVSFPPVPSLIEYLLTPFFGRQTPNDLLIVIYVLISSAALAYMFARKNSVASAVCYALLCTVGTNLLASIAFGGVWHEAQAMSFMLCSLSVCLIGAKNKFSHGLSLFFAALAVGCRPFCALFIPFLLFELYKKQQGNIGLKLVKMLPYLISPALVAVGLCAYNYVRFGNIFEFGHNYLPEFTRVETGQFSGAYLKENLKGIFQLPEFDGKHISFDSFGNNAFYIVNPCIWAFFSIWLFDTVNAAKACAVFNKNAWSVIYNALFICTVAAFTVVTCMHKTLGGWQFGSRYFLDMIPFLAMFMANVKIKSGVGEWTVCAFSILLNFYGGTLV